MKLNHPMLIKAAHESHRFACDIFSKPAAGRLLILVGPNGCGKTHISKNLCAWFDDAQLKLPLVRGRNESGEIDVQIAARRFVNWAQVIDGIKQEQWEIFDWLNSSYLTVIDDIGAEHDPSGVGREKLYLLLNAREYRYTVITTNIMPNEWEKKFTRRIASRLMRNSTVLNLSTVPDFNA